MAQEVTPLTTGAIKQNETAGTLVRPHDMTTLYATGKNPYAGEGDAMEVHPELAQKLIKKGFATDKEPAKTKKTTDA